MNALTNAQRDLVAEYMGLSRGVVLDLLRKYPQAKYLREDMVQEGYLALMHSARTFDPERGLKFGTWAYRHVVRCVKEFMRETLNPVAGCGRSGRRAGVPGTFFTRAPTEHPDGTPVEYATVEKNPILDCAESEVRKARDQLVGMVKSRSQVHFPERDVDVFLYGILEPFARGTHAGFHNDENWVGSTMSPQNVDKIRKRVRPFFQELCDMYQREAA